MVDTAQQKDTERCGDKSRSTGLLCAIASSIGRTASQVRIIEHELANAERERGRGIVLIANEVAKQTPHDIFYWLNKNEEFLLATHRRLNVCT